MKFLFTLILTVASFFSIAQVVQLEEFATGLTTPVEIANCGDDRLFIVQQDGVIKIAQSDGTILTNPFLTITPLISNAGEQGLLGMAFHPNFVTNGFFFVNYIRVNDGATVIARYKVSGVNNNQADPLGEEVLVIPQPYSNHKGGSLHFGPDGFLYIAMGDGGSGGDPDNYGQNKQSLLGKLLRINVDQLPYSIPPTNPYANGTDGRPEIYSLGLRNPWKFSFDSVEQKIWIADVGQSAWEEINSQPITDANLNYGWRCYEGNVAYNMENCDPNAAYVTPIHVYSLDGSPCSITGGYVYRGAANPAWQGHYFYTDYCTNEIYVLNPETQEVTTNTGFFGNFSTFGQDYLGELYVAGRNSGTVHKLTSPTASVSALEMNELQMHPNPSKGTFQLETEETIFSVTLLDLEGRVVEHYENTKTIAVKSVDSGTYLLNYRSAKRQKTIKVVITN